MAGGSEATTGVTDAPVSDYGRGKRLRKLVRLLSSKAALQVVVAFRFKVILLVLAIGVIHLAAFGVLVGFLSKQYTYLDEVEAAGDVLGLVHRVASLSVALEAAQRGQGFAAGAIPKYAAEMEESYNRCTACGHAKHAALHTLPANPTTPSSVPDVCACGAAVDFRLNQLHEGLYLGFSGLRTLEDSKLYHLWHDSDISATTYLDAANPTVSSVQTTSLFALGGMVVSAAKELQFAVLNPDTSENTGPLATLRSYHFLQANGPGTLYEPYVKTLDLMVGAWHV